jgi:hypothetical protein
MKPRDALAYAGVLGHTIAVVEYAPGGFRVCGECDDLATARQWKAEAPNTREIYQRRTMRRSWHLVPA